MWNAALDERSGFPHDAIERQFAHFELHLYTEKPGERPESFAKIRTVEASSAADL